MIIFHVTTSGEWEQARSQGYYEAASLATEGFIHCSTAEQVKGVIERYFAGVPDLIKLSIDSSKLQAPLKFELAPSINQEFPHIYGRLNLDAVTNAERLN